MQVDLSEMFEEMSPLEWFILNGYDRVVRLLINMERFNVGMITDRVLSVALLRKNMDILEYYFRGGGRIKIKEIIMILLRNEERESVKELLRKMDELPEMSEMVIEYLERIPKEEQREEDIRLILRYSKGDISEMLCQELVKEERMWIWKLIFKERQGNKLTMNSIEIIVKEGSLELIKYMYELTGLKYISKLIYVIAFINLKTEIVEWLNEVCHIDKTNKERWDEIKEKAVENIKDYNDVKKLIGMVESQVL